MFTADSLLSGNSKDVLISFFQLAVNNLTGQNKELNFNSNPFAIMLKSNPSLAIDSDYYKYRRLRKLNFDIGLKLDSSYRFNGFSSGIKYALINKRDTTTSEMLFKQLGSAALPKERVILNTSLGKYADSLPPAKEEIFLNEVSVLFNDTTPFKKLDTSFQRIVKNIAEREGLVTILKIITFNPGSSLKAESSVEFSKLKNLIKSDLLWTVGIADTTYKDQLFFANILFSSELSKGLGKPKPGSNWEFDVKANANLIKDTSVAKRNLKRCLFTFEPGFNYVIRNKNNDQSFLELKFSGSYHHFLRGVYKNEKRDSLTFNGTVRLRIINDIWVPLEIKYDPVTGNVFGFLNVRINFTVLGKNKS